MGQKFNFKELIDSYKNLFIIIFIISLPVNATIADIKNTKPGTPLSEEEIEWLKEHPVIRLAPDPEFRPIEYFNDNGEYVGMAADYSRLIGKKLGIEFRIVRCANWNEVIEKAKKREVDLLNAAVKTPQRERFLNFAPPYLKIPSVIIVRKSEKRKLTLNMLHGKKIAMVSGYGYVDLIKNRYPGLKIELVTDLKTALYMVSFDLADAFVGDLATASYYIESEGITNLRLSNLTEPPNVSGFAVRSDWPELSVILSKGASLLTDEERDQIYRKWIHLETEPALTLKELRNLLLVISGFSLFLFGTFMFWTRTLKKQVQKRTFDLTNELGERKRVEQLLANSEAMLRTIIQTIPDLVWLKNMDGVYILCNSIFERFYGARESDITGKTDYDFVDKDLADFFRRNDRIAFEARGPVKNEEWITFADDGHRALLETVKTPMFDTKGKILGILGIGRDITSRYMAEKEIREKNEELADRNNEFEAMNEELNASNRDLMTSEEKLNRSLREKETLLRELYHRTKNTMQIIRGMLVLQAEEFPDNTEVQRVIKNTEDRIQSISIVHQMLYQSRDLSKISIRDYIDKLAVTILNSFGITDNRIRITLEIEEQSFLLDTAIPFGLILNELMTNSMKYAFPDVREGEIFISLKKDDSGVNRLVYFDDGIGVPANFSFREQNTMGLQLIFSIGEQQMMGKIDMLNNNGVRCIMEFRNNLYNPRV